MPNCFPSPWPVEKTDACFIVRDANGHALAYVYFEDEPSRRSATRLMTRDEARRVAANIAKLPYHWSQIPDLMNSLEEFKNRKPAGHKL